MENSSAIFEPILARRPPFCLEPTKTNAETNLTRCGGLEDGMLFSVVSKNNSCLRQGKCRPTVANKKEDDTGPPRQMEGIKGHQMI